jgi:hypothetical protein
MREGEEVSSTKHRDKYTTHDCSDTILGGGHTAEEGRGKVMRKRERKRERETEADMDKKIPCHVSISILHQMTSMIVRFLPSSDL